MNNPNDQAFSSDSDQFSNVMIRASAGTGKTFQLSNRYLKLLFSGIDCQEILATTFSRKGAGEILDRVVQRLADAALSQPAAEVLAAQLEMEIAQTRAADVLQQLMKNLHRLEIGTLDSFFNRVAKAFSLELGLPPSWDIVEEQQIDRLRVQTVQKILYNDHIATLLHLMVKGESSRRIASLIMDTVKRLYGTRRESDEKAWDRLPEPDGFLDPAELAGVIDLANNITFKKGKAIPKHWEEVKGLLETENWAAVAELKSLQNVLSGIHKYGSAKLPPETVAVLEQLIPHCRAWITKRLIEQNRSTCELLGNYREMIEKTKGDTGQLRFEDVTERLVQFVSIWNTDRFSFRLDRQIRHLLLDEFQDTSPQQWSVIQPFAENVCCENDASRSFFCVGDMKQAIFGWRGGVAEIFDLVDDELDGIKQAALSASYRSSQPVVDLTNSIFTNLKTFNSDNEVINGAVHSWQEWFGQHTTTKDELSGYVSVEYANDSPGPGTGTPREVQLRNRNFNVTQAAVQRVVKIIEQIPDNEEHSIGVLVRSNAEVGDLIFKLQQAGIPASEEGGNPLTDSAAVELILSALKLADHPGDSIARFHVSHSPLANLFGLEPEDEENRAENEKVAAAGAANMRRRLISDGYGPTVEAMARDLAEQCTLRELTRLQHLVRLAFASRSDSERWAMRPSRFVNYIRDEVKISDESSARVRVMTIHKSKGLEFDSVVLPQKHVNTGWLGHTPPVIVGRKSPTSPIDTVCRYANEKHRRLLPAQVQEIFDEDRKRTVREALCVLYVAITRAVHSVHVILSYSAKPHDKSAAGLMLSTLCPESERAEGIIYERGDENWYQSLTHLEVENETTGSSEDLEEFYLQSRDETLFQPLSIEPRSLRGVPRVTPSDLEGGGRVRLSDTLKTDEKEMNFEVGTLMHGCYELMTWLEDEIPSNDELVEHLQKLRPGSPLISSAIKSFKNSLKHENVLRLLSKASYREQFVLPETGDTEANRLELFNEKSFAVILNDEESSADEVLARGVIDRLVLIYENNTLVAADVIDFKSDQITDTNLTERIGHYRPQIEVYRAAIAKSTGLSVDLVSSKLVFVQSGQVIHLDMIDNDVDGQTPLRVGQKKRIDNLSTRSKKPDRPASNPPTTVLDSNNHKEAAPASSVQNVADSNPEPSYSKPIQAGSKSSRPDRPTGKVPKAKSSQSEKEKTHTQKTLWSDDPE